MDYIDEIKKKDALVEKLGALSVVWRRWIELYQKNIKIEKYFIERNIKKIAIYGMSDLGIALYRELMPSSVEVLYGIDMERRRCEFDVEIKTPNEVDDMVDMVVVTPISHFSAIYDSLNTKLENRVEIIGIDEIIMELLIEE